MNDLMTDVVSFLQEKLPDREFVEDENIFCMYTPDEVDKGVFITEGMSYRGFAPWTNTSVRTLNIICRDNVSSLANELIWDVIDAFNVLGNIIEFKSGVKAIVAIRNNPIMLSLDDFGRSNWYVQIAITYNYK
ncbi:MAG: minor capsid protein [Paraclostridium sp.]